jgi:hypothetical protein
LTLALSILFPEIEPTIKWSYYGNYS